MTNMPIPSQVLDLVLRDIVLEGILDSDVPQMQGFEDKSVFWRFHITISTYCLFVCRQMC